MKPPHNITINFADVGCFLTVGCKTLCYADNQQMLIDLASYVNNPEETIKVMQEQHPGLKEQYRTRGPLGPPETGVAYDPESVPAGAGMIGMPSGATFPFNRD